MLVDDVKKRENSLFASKIDTISIFIAGVKATFIHVKAGRVSMTDLISHHISRIRQNDERGPN